MPISLLGPDDPPAVEVHNDRGKAAILLVCDHASEAIPRRLGDLGVTDADRRRHIGYDIGAAMVARRLAAAFDAPLVLSGYSRLVVDCNRRLDDPTAMPPISDGTVIPGNRDLGAEERAARVEALYAPYHRTIADRLDRFMARGVRPAFISVHSCTPVMAGFARPWHVGVLWNRDDRISGPLIAALERDGSLCVGDNQPYSGRGPHGFTVPHHAEPKGLPHVMLEIRQDLIEEAGGATVWADRLYRVFTPILARLEG